MELVNKPDYSYLTTSFTFDKMKLFFLSRHIGIPADEVVVDFPAPPSISVLQRITSHFPVTQRGMIFMNQVHSDEVINKVNKKPSFPTADAIITKERQLALCLKTADCVPIFLFDPKKEVIAAVHAGWRGTALKIVRKTIKKMQHFYKSEPEDVYTFIGPAIGSCCYKVGKDVIEHFNFLGRSKHDYITKFKGEKYTIDLKGINSLLAEQEGVLPEHIEISDLCTFCHSELFHSYRRDGEQAGRNVSFITLL